MSDNKKYKNWLQKISNNLEGENQKLNRLTEENL